MTVKNIEKKGNETFITVEIDKELMEQRVTAVAMRLNTGPEEFPP